MELFILMIQTHLFKQSDQMTRSDILRDVSTEGNVLLFCISWILAKYLAVLKKCITKKLFSHSFTSTLADDQSTEKWIKEEEFV